MCMLWELWCCSIPAQLRKMLLRMPLQQASLVGDANAPGRPRAFGIPARELKRLPAARSLPGAYIVKYNIKRSRPQRLVSVRAAKELALKLHGGTEASLAAHLRAPATAAFSAD